MGLFTNNKNGKVFAAHRADTREKAWQMPQGGIDGNEEPLDAAKRRNKKFYNHFVQITSQRFAAHQQSDLKNI